MFWLHHIFMLKCTVFSQVIGEFAVGVTLSAEDEDLIDRTVGQFA